MAPRLDPGTDKGTSKLGDRRSRLVRIADDDAASRDIDAHIIGGVLQAEEEAAAVSAPSCLRVLPQQLALLIGLWDDAALEVLDPWPGAIGELVDLGTGSRDGAESTAAAGCGFKKVQLLIGLALTSSPP